MRVPRLRASLIGGAVALALGGSLLMTAAPASAASTPSANLAAKATGSAITSMWAWGNPIDPAVDARGQGDPEFAPKALAAFASAHKLKTVYLSVPWAADEGPFSSWLKASITALHRAGVTTVAALGGDPAWADDPDLAATWTRAALKAAPFDAIQFDVEPWVDATEDELPGIVDKLATMYDAAADAARAVPVGADLPWWLAAKQNPAGGTLFGELLPHLDSVAIVAFVDHARGDDGIIALAGPAAREASVARTPYSIGVETDSPEVAGGPGATFGDDSAALLESETALVRSAFSSVSGYAGVTVEHLLSWQDLIAK
ncbi:hypothetical protein IT072_11460 [Leifsonia sp. ZF2019]|uniref:hypothetical protein n=1 Tax=Leifsonia sp. ZF2019 TaxID=2781978 RepID=UPI001CBA8405|nr:hypothetical protein [Leifsonia sp. ZF2019]UAJ77915.1 hypothetical protein IT072_11460 [Leifsonia sp. ZF2019]